MRHVIPMLLITAVTASVCGACGDRATRPEDDCAAVARLGLPPAGTTTLTLETVPADSSVLALLAWDSTVPDGAGSRARDLGMTVLHEFHFQPRILVRGTGAQLRRYVLADTTAAVRFGAEGTLDACPVG